MTTFRTRQAPSPTGYLHIGTTRQMLFTKLFAMINSGTYFLRLEDTDRSRLQPDAAKGLFATLSQLGLSPDEGVNADGKGEKDSFYGLYQNGEYGPYIQSERNDLHKAFAQTLIDKKLAYWSYITPDEKNELQDMKRATKKAINYFLENIKRNPKLAHIDVTEIDPYNPPQEVLDETELLFRTVEDALQDERQPALFYRLQRNDEIESHDLLVGKTVFDLRLEEDFVILKSDGFPTYHLAHIFDDYTMETSLVIRAYEWYASLAKHVTMWQDIHGHAPEYIHLPVILGETGNKKLSKRDGNVNTQDYLDKGYLPEALINYIAFLGWNPGTEQELFLTKEDFAVEGSVEFTEARSKRIQTLIQRIAAEFSIDKLSSGNARFNLEKLDWFNKEYVKMMSNEEFLFWTTGKNIHEELTVAAAHLDKQRITVLSEAGMESDCITHWKKPGIEEIKWKKITEEESMECLQNIFEHIKTQSINSVYNKGTENNFQELFQDTASQWEATLKSWLTENGKDTGSHLWPLRVALSGKKRSPSPFELLAILPQAEVSKRLESVLGR